MPFPTRLPAPAALACLLLATTPALADDWDVVLGFGAAHAPTYDGAGDGRLVAVPLVDLSWRDAVFLNSGGLGVNVLRRDGLDLAASVGLTPGRKDDDDSALEGLDEIDPAASLRLAATQSLAGFDLGVGLTRTLGDEPGTQVDLGVARSFQVSGRPSVDLGLAAVWADEDRSTSRYGVSGREAAASGLAAFAPSSGLDRAEITIGGTYAVTERTFVGASATLGRLLGDAADSPVVQDDTQVITQLVVGRRF